MWLEREMVIKQTQGKKEEIGLVGAQNLMWIRAITAYVHTLLHQCMVPPPFFVAQNEQLFGPF